MKRLTMIAALWLGASATAVGAAVPPDLPCLTENEAQSVVLVALPDILDAVGKTCATALPPQATLRAGLPALVARYRGDGDAAWRSAKPVITKLGGDQLKGVDPDMLRPMIGTLLGPLVAKDIKPGDCPRIDKITTLLAPLPIANTAALVVELFQLGSDHSKKRAPFSICADHG
jgi:hypothetical protein